MKKLIRNVLLFCVIFQMHNCFGKLVYGKTPNKQEIENAQRSSKNIFDDGELVIVRLDREQLYKDITGFAAPDKYTVGKIMGNKIEGTDQLRKMKAQGYEVKREKYTLLPYPKVRARIGFYTPDQIGKTAEKKKSEKILSKDTDKDKKKNEEDDEDKQSHDEDDEWDEDDEDDDEVEWEEDDEWEDEWGESEELTPEQLRELLRS